MIAATAGQLNRSLRHAAAAPGPAFVLPLLPPLLMVVVFTALFGRLDELGGFGGGDYVTYLAPGAVTLTAMLGGGFTSESLVTDLRDGFHDRLRLLVASPTGVVLGRSAVEGLRVLPAAVTVLVVAGAMGADLDVGVGVLVALVLTALLSAAFGTVFHLAGIASGDPAAAAAMAPLGLVLGFLSTALVPVTVVPDWAATVARANPVSVVADGVRAALDGSVASSDVVAAVAVGAAWLAIGTLATTFLLASRDRRNG